MATAECVTVDSNARTVSGRFVALQGASEAGYFVLGLPDMALALTPGVNGVERQSYRGLDGRTKTDLILQRVPLAQVEILAEGEIARATLKRACAMRAAAITAECCGLAAALFDDTLAYLKQRRQFGQPIGSFQAVQHRLADMF
ncbi:acyl-CoA dehydrogenase family protein, partial [Cribrihabitans sp. XS_ASV171]